MRAATWMNVAVAVGLAAAAGSAVAQESAYVLTDPLSPSLLRLDPVTGQVLGSVQVTGHQSLFGGLAVDASGTMYSIDGYNDEFPDRLFRIDPASGAGAVVGPTGLNWNFRTVTVDPRTDTLYGASDSPSPGLYTLDRATGAATFVRTFSAPTYDQMTALAIDRNGIAWFTDIGDTGLFRMDLTGGTVTHVGDIGGSGNWFNDLAFDSQGRLHGARLNGGVYTIDTTNATITLDFNGSYTGLVYAGGAPPCRADFDGDGLVNVQDFLAFLQAFAQADDRADITDDGQVNVQDFLAYLQLFSAGC
jgi:streptogramin lyase